MLILLGVRLTTYAKALDTAVEKKPKWNHDFR
jgi:hypothetical protein